MRTVGEIIEAAKDGRDTTTDELVYALIAVSALHHFASSSLRTLASESNRFRTPMSECEEDFRRTKAFYAKDAKECVGWNNDPKNPEYQRFRSMAMKLADKVMHQDADAPTRTGEE